MYYKIYRITKEQDESYKDIHILRFSYNPFYDSESESKDKSEKITKLLEELIEQGRKDKSCFNSIHPWENIIYETNNEIIIAYNKKTNQIQGWCNIKYDSYNIDNDNGEEAFYKPIEISKKPKMIYTCYIDKLVARALPKIKYIGLLLLEFVRDITIIKPLNDNKGILFYEKDVRNPHSNEYNNIIIDIIYLYASTTSIDFYKKTFLTQSISHDSEKENEIFNHVFKYIRDNRLHNISASFRKQLRNLCDLDTMECKSIISESDKNKYETFKPDEKCKQPNKQIDYIDDSDTLINYNVDRIYGSRTTRSSISKSSLKSLSKSKSKSIIKK